MIVVRSVFQSLVAPGLRRIARRTLYICALTFDAGIPLARESSYPGVPNWMKDTCRFALCVALPCIGTPLLEVRRPERNVPIPQTRVDRRGYGKIDPLTPGRSLV